MKKLLLCCACAFISLSIFTVRSEQKAELNSLKSLTSANVVLDGETISAINRAAIELRKLPNASKVAQDINSYNIAITYLGREIDIIFVPKSNKDGTTSMGSGPIGGGVETKVKIRLPDMKVIDVSRYM